MFTSPIFPKLPFSNIEKSNMWKEKNLIAYWFIGYFIWKLIFTRNWKAQPLFPILNPNQILATLNRLDPSKKIENCQLYLPPTIKKISKNG